MIVRHLMQSIETALTQFPAVALIGSRQAGKTTLAKVIAARQKRGTTHLDLELPSDLARLAEPELYLDTHADKLVVLDEVQRRPDLFPVLRGLIDRDRRPGRLLILGSASPDLLRQSSESQVQANHLQPGTFYSELSTWNSELPRNCLSCPPAISYSTAS